MRWVDPVGFYSRRYNTGFRIEYCKILEVAAKHYFLALYKVKCIHSVICPGLYRLVYPNSFYDKPIVLRVTEKFIFNVFFLLVLSRL